MDKLFSSGAGESSKLFSGEPKADPDQIKPEAWKHVIVLNNTQLLPGILHLMVLSIGGWSKVSFQPAASAPVMGVTLRKPSVRIAVDNASGDREKKR